MDHSPKFLEIVSEAKKKIREVSVKEAADLSKKPGVLLIDVRELEEWNGGHAEGAIHLSKGVIERDIESIAKDPSALILCYCGGGYRSALVAENLQRMGYSQVKSVAGGWRAWKQANLPVSMSPGIYPRSPYEKLGGLIHLPRLIDKARLAPQGKLPGYNYLTTGFDKMLLDFLCVEPNEFEKAVQNSATDEEVLGWLKNKLGPGWPTNNAISDFNNRIMSRRPDTPERKVRFEQMLAALPQAPKKIETYFDLIDLDEGRLK